MPLVPPVNCRARYLAVIFLPLIARKQIIYPATGRPGKDELRRAVAELRSGTDIK